MSDLRDMSDDDLLWEARNSASAASASAAISELRRRLAEVARLRKACERAQSACGAPDAAEGCRIVLRILGEALGDSRA